MEQSRAWILVEGRRRSRCGLAGCRDSCHPATKLQFPSAASSCQSPLRSAAQVGPRSTKEAGGRGRGRRIVLPLLDDRVSCARLMLVPVASISEAGAEFSKIQLALLAVVQLYFLQLILLNTMLGSKVTRRMRPLDADYRSAARAGSATGPALFFCPAGGCMH